LAPRVNESLKRLFGVDRSHMIGKTMGKTPTQMNLVKTKDAKDDRKREILVRRAFFMAFNDKTTEEIIKENEEVAEYIKKKMFK